MSTSRAMLIATAIHIYHSSNENKRFSSSNGIRMRNLHCTILLCKTHLKSLENAWNTNIKQTVCPPRLLQKCKFCKATLVTNKK